MSEVSLLVFKLLSVKRTKLIHRLFRTLQARDKFARSVWEIVSNQYTVLNRASYGGEGLNASTSCTQLSQPWFEVQNGSH